MGFVGSALTRFSDSLARPSRGYAVAEQQTEAFNGGF